VTVPARSRHGRAGITLHRVRHLHEDDRTLHENIPVTTVARTLLDVAEVRPTALERAFEEAERRRILDVRAVEDVCERSHGRRGVRPVRALLASTWEPPPLTRSGVERRFLDLCREAGLPRPAVNVVVAGYEVDMLWEEHKLVVELDTRGTHGTRAAFERDRLRDATLLMAGYRVLRFTDRRLETDAAGVVATLRALIAADATLSPI
jgi:hypothetical protein